MKTYPTSKIRNIALVGHGGAGKTSLVEAMAKFAGATNRLGRIEDGSTLSDFDDEEKRRQMSVNATLVSVEYNDHKYNLLDTPGFADFVGEVKSALQVADAAIIVVDATSGVEVGTERVWQYCDELNLPRIIVINKMDRENANFEEALASVQALAEDRKLVPAVVPIGAKQNFSGVIGLLSRGALYGSETDAKAIPPEHADAVEEGRTAFIEAAAEGDDELIMKYLDGEELTNEEIMRGFGQAIIQGSFAPVLVTSATNEVGIYALMQALWRYLPSPDAVPRTASQQEVVASDDEPLSLFAFKTTADPYVGRMTFFRVMAGKLTNDSKIWNFTRSAEERFGTFYTMCGKEQIAVDTLHAGDLGMVPKLGHTLTGDSLGDKAHPLTFDKVSFPSQLYSVAVTPATQADASKMGTTLTRLTEEDLTLRWYNDTTTKETILSGMGDQHIDLAIHKAEARFGTKLQTALPRVPYRETITKPAAAMYRHKKQTGGAGQFGEVHMRVEPLEVPDGEEAPDLEFANEVFGGAVSNNYMPAIEKGVRSVMEQGAIAGYPLEALKVAITDGKEHPVDSKPVAFEIAGREAFKEAVRQAGARLLEPVMSVEIIVPESAMGDVLSDLNTRRARVLGMDQQGRKSVIKAEVPLAEMQRYVTDLRSFTQGRGAFEMSYLRHELVPPHLQQDIVDAAKKDDE